MVYFFVCSFVVFPLRSITTYAVLSDFYLSESHCCAHQLARFYFNLEVKPNNDFFCIYSFSAQITFPCIRVSKAKCFFFVFTLYGNGFYSLFRFQPEYD